MPRRDVVVDPRFGQQLRQLREARGLSLAALAKLALSSRSHLHEFETGKAVPAPDTLKRLDEVLDAGGCLLAMVRPTQSRRAPAVEDGDDEYNALELARRVSASDVGEETITRLEAAVDDLATRYSVTPPVDMLARVRRHLRYVGQMMEPTVRKSLGEHHRLVVVGAWLSLLGATIHIDLQQDSAAEARLETALSLAKHAGQTEITAWVYETRAWATLTEGNYRAALQLSQTAQQIAPAGSSALIQATAQEGRAWARLGQQRETYAALDRVARLVGTMERPDRPEHHYRYDPDKAIAYVATTLAWLGDPSAERYAREVIARLRDAEDAGGWPRRVASAQVDLGLALVAARKHDEAAAVTQQAVLSGRIVPSNQWRVVEVLTAVERAGLPEAADLRDAFEALSAQPPLSLPPRSSAE